MHDLEAKVDELTMLCNKLHTSEEEHLKAIAELTSNNEQWEQRTQELFVTLQQNEIMQEKSDYEKQTRIRDMATKLKEQKLEIMEYEEVVLQLRAENNALSSKNIIGISPGRDNMHSFLDNNKTSFLD